MKTTCEKCGSTFQGEVGSVFYCRFPGQPAMGLCKKCAMKKELKKYMTLCGEFNWLSQDKLAVKHPKSIKAVNKAWDECLSELLDVQGHLKRTYNLDVGEYVKQ